MQILHSNNQQFDDCQFQCRGWGTDLVPPHMSQIYNQQMTLAEQVDTNMKYRVIFLTGSAPKSSSVEDGKSQPKKWKSELKFNILLLKRPTFTFLVGILPSKSIEYGKIPTKKSKSRF